jgi:hypothetical protein
MSGYLFAGEGRTKDFRLFRHLTEIARESGTDFRIFLVVKSVFFSGDKRIQSDRVAFHQNVTSIA